MLQKALSIFRILELIQNHLKPKGSQYFVHLRKVNIVQFVRPNGIFQEFEELGQFVWI